MIDLLRQRDYPGSELIFEQALWPGYNHNRYLVSYQSEGYKIYGLLAEPLGDPPPGGWPVIIFNHGYVPPRYYNAIDRYGYYIGVLASSGYIVLSSDYRGHGYSEGVALGGYITPNYTVDVLNALTAVKGYEKADPERIGMWGHSMGGLVTLRSMVISQEIDAGVIWGGMVVSYWDLIERGRWQTILVSIYGTEKQNPAFWASISPNSYVGDLSGPLQLHHSKTDATVPVEFSEILYEEVRAAGMPVELHLYDWDNHNLSVNFWTAMDRSIAFFDEHVKNANKNVISPPSPFIFTK